MYREPIVKGRKPGLKPTVWNKEEISIQQKQKEETRIQKKMRIV